MTQQSETSSDPEEAADGRPAGAPRLFRNRTVLAVVALVVAVLVVRRIAANGDRDDAEAE